MFLESIDFNKKKIILRVDFNVPFKDGSIQSTKRIDAAMPTINLILKNNPDKIFIISHLGRPKGIDDKLSLKPIQNYLNKTYNLNIGFSSLNNISKVLNKIILIENIRFHPEETKKISTTPDFRKKLTELGDVFINDAFGCCHREHSSIVGIDCPEKYLGLLVKKELIYLQDSLKKPGKKALLLGGSKVSDKIKLINNLIPIMDNIFIGGGMAFTFIKFMGIDIGNSLFDEEGFKMIPDILKNAEKNNTQISLPIDFKCNNSFNNEGDIIEKDIILGIEKGYMGLDIGKKTVKLFIEKLKDYDIVFWNGPMGVFEFSNFENGSKSIMNYLAESNKTVIIGGGDTSSCCEKYNLTNKMTHDSTGGGASLELLEGKELPGIKFIK